jgi:signal peptidase I
VNLLPENFMTSKERNSTEAPLWLRAWRTQKENLQLVVIALCLALLIRTFVAEPRYIPSDSMLPTLEMGDRLVVEKISYRFRPPKPGDIVVFDPPQQLQILGYAKDQAFIKRIIGKPGQIVSIAKGKVYLNSEPLQEDYIAEPPAYQWGPQRIPDEEFFVMGDNRNDSNDSHIWGFLPRQNIIGHARFRFWPLNRSGFV